MNRFAFHWGYQPPPHPSQKHHRHLACQGTPQIGKLSNTPFLSNPPSILVFCESPLKVGFFSELQKYESFSSLIPSHLLKVTKFSGQISQFEFLVMTGKNIFAYKLYLSLNISDFNLFFMWKLQPPLKKLPSLSQQPPFKS